MERRAASHVWQSPTMLTLTSASLATVDELFEFKAAGFELPQFPGYTLDQWGIKAHNRPWIAQNGRWSAGHRVIEVGGAYSRLPEWLGEEHGVEPWVGDDFGKSDGDPLWARWGDPGELPSTHPTVTYVFENFGRNSPSFPAQHFDRVFSVSTLEHIPYSARLEVLKDMNRVTASGGMQLHTIDIPVPSPRKVAAIAAMEAGRARPLLRRKVVNGISAWMDLFAASGVEVAVRPPRSLQLLDRRVLVESPDVVYRFYEPTDAPTPYRPSVSLLVTIEDL